MIPISPNNSNSFDFSYYHSNRVLKWSNSGTTWPITRILYENLIFSYITQNTLFLNYNLILQIFISLGENLNLGNQYQNRVSKIKHDD